MQAKLELARRIAARLGEIEGVVAVALGGSWARGEAHPGSDVDLGIRYRDEHVLRIATPAPHEAQYLMMSGRCAEGRQLASCGGKGKAASEETTR
jgi:hypothetical protein